MKCADCSRPADAQCGWCSAPVCDDCGIDYHNRSPRIGCANFVGRQLVNEFKTKEATMSWSVSRSGKRDEIRGDVANDFIAAAQNYAGTEEEKDILAAKERALSAIDGLDLAKEDGSGEYGVGVSCYGSRSTVNGKPISVTLSVSVSRAAT